VKPLKRKHQRQRREMFVGFSLSQNLKVQRTGILFFKMLRCAAPFGFSRYDFTTNIIGALHLAFLN
jgi:hypothetical protein